MSEHLLTVLSGKRSGTIDEVRDDAGYDIRFRHGVGPFAWNTPEGTVYSPSGELMGHVSEAQVKEMLRGLRRINPGVMEGVYNLIDASENAQLYADPGQSIPRMVKDAHTRGVPQR